MLPESTVTTGPLQDYVLGRKVRGTKTVEQSTAIRFTPHPTEIRLELLVMGEVASRTVTNAGSGFLLVHQILFHPAEIDDTVRLLAAAGSIYATNIVVFALWYWHSDRGGQGRRAAGTGDLPMICPTGIGFGDGRERNAGGSTVRLAGRSGRRVAPGGCGFLEVPQTILVSSWPVPL
jgi:hypothetical protein